MRSVSGGFWNLTMSCVPPENSTPYWTPRVAMKAIPAAMNSRLPMMK
jgi:hypothetical protein